MVNGEKINMIDRMEECHRRLCSAVGIVNYALTKRKISKRTILTIIEEVQQALVALDVELPESNEH